MNKNFKIGLTGSMSVGKTSLINALKKLPQFENYKFETEKSVELRDMGIKLNTDSTLKGQMIFGSYRAKELMGENLLTDRTIIDVIAFTNLAESIDSYQKIEFEHLYSNLISEYDYIFYVTLDGMDIEDNNIRETDPIYREKIDKEIKRLLNRYEPFISNLNIISGGTIEERVQQVLKAISV